MEPAPPTEARRRTRPSSSSTASSSDSPPLRSPTALSAAKRGAQTGETVAPRLALAPLRVCADGRPRPQSSRAIAARNATNSGLGIGEEQSSQLAEEVFTRRLSQMLETADHLGVKDVAVGVVQVVEPDMDRRRRLRRIAGASSGSDASDAQRVNTSFSVVRIEGLGQIVVHPRRQAALLIGLHGGARDGDDRGVGDPLCRRRISRLPGIRRGTGIWPSMKMA